MDEEYNKKGYEPLCNRKVSRLNANQLTAILGLCAVQVSD
ncbi:hypothetical protein TTHN1_00676 [Thermus thermophilus]|uniref:Uncharacterized protein n=1 Tax=Thermus thermophilus TaxID=274 RepID=A0A3P4APB8_THETH|nr:hypothetical protein TTHN1_00676 [Thermus thermophilus]